METRKKYRSKCNNDKLESKKQRKRSNSIDLLEISEMLTDNYDSINKILKNKRAQNPCTNNQKNINNNENNNENNKPAYWSQFDAQTFDSLAEPGAVNDTYATNDKNKLSDLERNLSYQGGWSQYQDDSNTYGIVDADKLTHNNMVPYFTTKKGYGSNDLLSKTVMNYKNDLFTGNLQSTWNKKQEITPMFKPEANLTHPYGTPIYTEEEASRFEPGRYKQGELPFEKKQVTPGLNLHYDEIATHGYHSMYRGTEKTVDELRVKPKITYEGRIIDGLKGKERPIQAPVITRKPDTYKTTTSDDLLPTSSTNTGPKTRDNFIMKDTNRHDQHIEYTGGAYSTQERLDRNVPEHMRSSHKASTRQNYILPTPLQKYGKNEAKFNHNIDSYDVTSTLKDMVIDNNRTGITGDGRSTYVNLMDNARETIKQITASLPQTNQNIKPNTMRGTVHNMDIANPTIKETTIENKLNPHVAHSDNAQRVYYNDYARPTIKQTTIDQLLPQNCNQNNNIYANWSDNARPTIKETTVSIHQNNIATPVGQQQRGDIMDIAKNTLKETTNHLSRNNFTTPIGQQQGADIQDIAKCTIKQTTVPLHRNNFATPINQQQGADIQDIARCTTKQTTVSTPWNTNTTPVGQQQRGDIMDTARSTMKETTNDLHRNNFMTPIGQQQRGDIMDTARSTIKETTNDLHRNNFMTPIGQQQRGDIMDTARSTMKETTNDLHRNNFMTPIGQQQRGDIMDTARSTMKETTNDLHRNNFMTPVGQQQRGDIMDTARSTMKETTNDLHRNNFMTPIGQQQRGDIMDTARSTMKETTNNLHRNNFMTPIGQQQRGDIMDTARSTIKETTNNLHRNNFMTPIGQQQRGNIMDIARSTMKETTNDLHRNNFMTPIGQQQRGDIMDTARSTMKETTNGLYRNTHLTPVGQQQRADIADTAKSTMKETTIQIPYNTYTTAVGQQQGAIGPQDNIRTTIKETVNQLARNTYLSGSQENRGKADVFDRNPLRTVTKETTVVIPYNTNIAAVNQQQRAPNPQDAARTTIKESTVQIPYNNMVSGVEQKAGQSTTFNRMPTKSTIKETTINNEYIGSVNNNVTGKGYGYLSEKHQAPNTTRQFTCQEVYVAPVLGENKNRPYDDAYNFVPDDKKESVKIYREPTNNSVKIGPDVENVNARLKSDNHKSRVPILGTSFNNRLDRPEIITQHKINDNIDSQRFVDPTIVQQLQNNPFNITYYGNM
ncbi:hypothetical protein [Acanthamoeba polyphaga mimivirus]|uniref:Uncharacterized protein n=2 Tax=Megamimivirinae TaxID=3044648 RepID=A0A2L2DJ36_MIMIV|nr:hypothetical protein MegaChil _gp0434 [Megavirus chiliensis]AEQ33358.1 hypothetical protein [Megavirus chiliensis]AVG46165.1 hypothetical protein [Acanthamoeba polyphaga mimivirus]AVG47270.1 hypothetical protein [Acanthamoeba polyphaga mimivirus]